jgi:hypothetical protein
LKHDPCAIHSGEEETIVKPWPQVVRDVTPPVGSFDFYRHIPAARRRPPLDGMVCEDACTINRISPRLSFRGFPVPHVPAPSVPNSTNSVPRWLPSDLRIRTLFLELDLIIPDCGASKFTSTNAVVFEDSATVSLGPTCSDATASRQR